MLEILLSSYFVYYLFEKFMIFENVESTLRDFNN